MVLKLIDICMNSISKNLDQIKNLDACLTSTQKELIIQRLANHSQFYASHLDTIIKSLFTANIKCIKFYKCEQINESFLKSIGKKTEFQLKSLTIVRCDNVTDDGLKAFIENQYSLEDICFKRLNNPFVQTFQCLKAAKLSLVDLSYSPTVTDKDLVNLCKNNPNIKSLILTHCISLTNEGFKSAFSFLNDLECLDIEGIKGIDESSIIKFKNLKKLNFYGSDHLNSISLIKLFENCTRLRELNILYSWSPQNGGNTQDQPNNPVTPQFTNSLLYIPDTLETLILFRPSIREPQVLIDALKRLKCLKKLSLHCVECINDQTLTQILEFIGPNLVFLDLGGYMAIPNRLTETSIKSIAKYCKNLEHLCLDLFSATATLDSLTTLFSTDYDLMANANKQAEINEFNCRRAFKLKTVRLSACRRVSYDLLLQVASYCVNLVHLDVSGLSELIDDNFMEILAVNATKLQILDLKACTKLTDKSICLLAVKCPLHCIVLSGIHSLTDKIIFVIANHLQFTLKEIYLSGCSKITSVALRYLADCCIKHLFCEHRVPNLDPNQLMAKNLDTGHFERVDQFNFTRK